MTVAVGARNLFKVDADVVHALLQARYYDGSKGEFLSEDPVFLGNPKQQVLSDPESLNSYSYANDNPITNPDPLGKFVELSGSLVAPGRAWSAGIRFDANGVDQAADRGRSVMWATACAETSSRSAVAIIEALQ